MMTVEMSAEKVVETWVEGFSAIPVSVIEKLMSLYCDEVIEITPLAEGDRVYIFNGEHEDSYGRLVRVADDDGDDDDNDDNDDDDFLNNEACIVCLDTGEEIRAAKSDFEVERDSVLPMWSTMWAFDSSFDCEWLDNKENLRKMAECGFRIYEQEDYGYIFGIDGCGYSFMEAHWIPLYKARFPGTELF